MLGMGTKAYAYSDGYIIDVVELDVNATSFTYEFDTTDENLYIYAFDQNYPFVTANYPGSRFYSIYMSDDGIDILYNGAGSKDYFDLGFRARDRWNNEFICYLRIKFVK